MTLPRTSSAAALLLVTSAGCRYGTATTPPSTPALQAVTIAVPYDLDTLDPHAADRLSAFAVLFNAYEGLVDADADLRIRPALAVSWESPDPLTWIFHLRPGVKFHGGKRLRAADVVYSFERLRRDPELQVGNFTKDIAEVSAVGELAVRLRTHSPCRVLLAKLRHVAIVPEGAADGLRLGSDGTGPFVAAPWQPGQEVVLSRHAGYWGGAPSLAAVRFALGRGPEQAIAGLQAGRYQLVSCESRSTLPSSGYVVKARDSLHLKYLAFDLGRETTPGHAGGRNPFRDLRVRRAVSLAIDRQGLASRLTSEAYVATQPVPRAVFGFDASIAEPVVDRDRARELLREAGFPRGFDVVLHARPFAREAGPAIQHDLEKAGIRARLRLVSEAEHFALLARKGLTLWVTRIGCTTGDASELFEDLIHSPDGKGRFGSLNDGGYSNPQLDAAIERSVGLERAEDRRAAFQKITRAVMADEVIVPLYNDRDVYAFDARLAWEPRADSEIRAADVGAVR